jgi:hypothetical protein
MHFLWIRITEQSVIVSKTKTAALHRKAAIEAKK